MAENGRDRETPLGGDTGREPVPSLPLPQTAGAPGNLVSRINKSTGVAGEGEVQPQAWRQVMRAAHHHPSICTAQKE